VVIIASSFNNYREIFLQLEHVGITEYISWYAFLCNMLWPRYVDIVIKLDDELSKICYLSTIYALLTGDAQFIRNCGEQYFGHHQFVNPFGQTIVDAGAYVGDSMEKYITKAFGNVKIYSFEPDKKYLPALIARKTRLCQEWLTDDEHIVIENESLGPAFTLDNYFNDKQPPSIIKSDIEGMEMEMLKGATRMLKTFKPKLAISIYHSPHDMMSIAEYVLALSVGYKIAVRNHCDHYEDTILYCWV
jgi:hypothetical protein